MANTNFPEEGEIASRFRHLMYKFASYLEPRNVDDIKFKYRDHLKNIYDSITDGKNLLLAFETCTPPLIHENNINLLEEIAKGEHFVELQELCEEYKKLEYIIPDDEQAQAGPEPFIGRESEIEEIHEVICAKESQDQRLPAIFIHGFPGIGKTRLAKEVISSFKTYHKTLLIDLREIKTVEAVYYALMNRLDKIAKQKLDMATLMHALAKRKKGLYKTVKISSDVIMMTFCYSYK